MKVEEFVKELMYQGAVFLAFWRHNQRTNAPFGGGGPDSAFPVDQTVFGWMKHFLKATKWESPEPGSVAPVVSPGRPLIEYGPYARAHAVLHKLWSKTPSDLTYVKAEWQELERAITDLARIARDGRA